ncbi:hypothetical protein GCM10020218_103540 [Dactylosporangium vinaceum]
MLMQLGTDGATFVLLHGVRLKVPAGQSSGPRPRGAQTSRGPAGGRGRRVRQRAARRAPIWPCRGSPAGRASQKKIQRRIVPVGTLSRSNNVILRPASLAQGLATIGE